MTHAFAREVDGEKIAGRKTQKMSLRAKGGGVTKSRLQNADKTGIR